MPEYRFFTFPGHPMFLKPKCAMREMN